MLKTIVDGINSFCDTNGLVVTKILVEPGRFVTSRCEVLLTKLNAIKVESDGTRFSLIFRIVGVFELALGRL